MLRKQRAYMDSTARISKSASRRIECFHTIRRWKSKERTIIALTSIVLKLQKP